MTLFLLLILSTSAGITPPVPPHPHIRAAVAAFRAGKLALANSKPANAADLFNQAIQIEPTFLDAYKELIATKRALHDELAAAAVMTKLLEIEPNLNRYRVQLGQILLSEKQWDKALAQFSIVLRQDPFNADALFGFANAAQQLGKDDWAKEAILKGRRRYPKDKRFSSPL